MGRMSLSSPVSHRVVIGIDEMPDERVTGAQCRCAEKPLLPSGSLYLGGEMSGTPAPLQSCEKGGALGEGH